MQPAYTDRMTQHDGGRYLGHRFTVVAGAAGTASGLGAAELAAALFTPDAGPVVAVGDLLIEIAPSWAAEGMIALFGTANKPVLIAGIVLLLLALGGLAGVLERRREPVGMLVVIAAGIVGGIATAVRPAFAVQDLIPVAAAVLVAGLGIRMLLRRLLLATTAPGPVAGAGLASGAGVREDPDRRRFLTWTTGTAALGALAAAGGVALQSGARAVTAVREALTLPAPATPLPPLPAGAELDIPDLTPVLTPNDEFFRIDTAIVVPQLEPESWSLRIHGLVEREVEIDWAELIALPLEESVTTLQCVSNEVGGDLIGTAVWLGYPIRELLARAGPLPEADMVLSRSHDGFTASTPIEVLQDERNAILAIGMNGEPLPARHGFPVRMIVPGLYGYVSATKWVVELEVTRFDRVTAYWTDRGWAEHGPVKLSSRIDVPRGSVTAGPVAVAGVAWHPHTGIESVEVQLDGGAWNPAELAPALSADSWVQWRWLWDAEPGSHALRVRATNSDGERQTAEVRGTVPDGATGLHSISVSVR